MQQECGYGLNDRNWLTTRFSFNFGWYHLTYFGAVIVACWWSTLSILLKITTCLLTIRNDSEFFLSYNCAYNYNTTKTFHTRKLSTNVSFFQMANLCWWYYISKLTEFVDTVSLSQLSLKIICLFSRWQTCVGGIIFQNLQSL